MNDSPRRCSSVACSFSSTVARICSSLAALSARNASRRCSTVPRTASRRCSLDSVSLASCSPNPCNCRCCNPAMSVSWRLRGFAELADRAADFVAQSCRGAGLLGARIGEVLPDVRFNARDLRAQGIAARARIGGFAQRFVAGLAQRGNAQQDDDAQHEQDDEQHEKGDLQYLGHGLGSLLGRRKRSKGREPVFAHVVASRQPFHAGFKVDGGRIAQDRCARVGYPRAPTRFRAGTMRARSSGHRDER